MERIGRGHAKLLLFGEHAAVYGFPSLGLGLPESTTITALPGAGSGWRFPDLLEPDSKRFGEFIATASKFLPELASGGGEIRISSTIPRGLGFGSSAALCVSLAEAFATGDGTSGDGTSPRAWSIAHRAEGFFHGKASGIDTGLSLFGGLRFFRPKPPGLPETGLLRSFPLHLVIGAVPRRASTATLIAALRERLLLNDEITVRLIEELGLIAKRAIVLFERGEDASSPGGVGSHLGNLLEKAQIALRALGLGDPSIDLLLQAGIEAGAIGGKQSGAGGGGAFFLVFSSEASALAAAEALDEFARRRGITLAAPLLAYSFYPAARASI